MKKNLPIMIVVVVIIAAGSFYGGVAYQKTKNISNRNFPNFQGQAQDSTRRFGNAQAGANFINGDILSKDANTLTIKLKDGGSKIVLYSTSTSVMTAATSSPDSLQVGESVMVNGISNSDGSLSAESIQVRTGMPNINPVVNNQ